MACFRISLFLAERLTIWTPLYFSFFLYISIWSTQPLQFEHIDVWQRHRRSLLGSCRCTVPLENMRTESTSTEQKIGQLNVRNTSAAVWSSIIVIRHTSHNERLSERGRRKCLSFSSNGHFHYVKQEGVVVTAMSLFYTCTLCLGPWNVWWTMEYNYLKLFFCWLSTFALYFILWAGR